MDWRVVVVLLPIIVAASWAGYNIARYAIQQVTNFFNKKEA